MMSSKIQRRITLKIVSFTTQLIRNSNNSQWMLLSKQETFLLQHHQDLITKLIKRSLNHRTRIKWLLNSLLKPTHTSRLNNQISTFSHLLGFRLMALVFIKNNSTWLLSLIQMVHLLDLATKLIILIIKIKTFRIRAYLYKNNQWRSL